MSHPTDDSEESIEERPSKSARKRAAHEAQDLGETLIGLRDSDLDALDLPETLADAIRLAQRTTSRGGGARQRQYIGKLMRNVDLEPIRAALNARSEQSALQAARFKRVEEWRERLLAEGAAALEELQRWRPGLERDVWLRHIGAAQAERARLEDSQGAGRIGAQGRELFRMLRALFERDAERSSPGSDTVPGTSADGK
jgi:ribosome-associated protein